MYLKECLDYMGIDEPQFYEIINKARPPHLWEYSNGVYHLKNCIWGKE